MNAEHPHAGERRTVTAVLPCPPERAYDLVSDVVATAVHSPEIARIVWEPRDHADGVRVGDRFTGRNRAMGMSWTSTSTVTTAQRGQCFAFAVSDPDKPTAVWTFDLRPAADGTTVTYTVELGNGPSMFDAVSGGDPERHREAVEYRLEALAHSMRVLLGALSRQAGERPLD